MAAAGARRAYLGDSLYPGRRAGEPISLTSRAGWQLVGAADFDGNGVPDLVYQNTQSGEVNVDYYGGPGGKTFKGWNVLSATGNPGWSVIVPRSR